MGIGFSFRNNIQIVSLEGALSTPEVTAIRTKLDQKLNQGRRCVLFSISAFAVSDKNSLAGLKQLLQYCITRGAVVGTCGLKKTDWSVLAIPGASNFQNFETEPDAKPWFETQEKKPVVSNENKSDQDIEQEIKQKKISELIKTYEMFFLESDFDPHILEKHWIEYQKTPHRDLMIALKKTLEHITQLEGSIQATDDATEKLSQSLLQAMSTRKIPISANELSSKKKSIEDVKKGVDKDVNELRSKLDEKLQLADSFKQKSQELQQKWETELSQLQAQIKHQTEQNKKVIADWEARDKKEQEALDKLKAEKAQPK